MSKDQKPELRRSVTPWGSFSWGYSAVGADIFVGLGLVLGAAAGASNVAFLFAGLVYICIGLAYTELAATYPVAGGGQYFVARGLGDVFGFIAGWAVLPDFATVNFYEDGAADLAELALPELRRNRQAAALVGWLNSAKHTVSRVQALDKYDVPSDDDGPGRAPRAVVLRNPSLRRSAVLAKDSVYGQTHGDMEAKRKVVIASRQQRAAGQQTARRADGRVPARGGSCQSLPRRPAGSIRPGLPTAPHQS